MKVFCKSNFISFLIGGVVFSAITAFAATILPGINISYNNTSSNLSSNNVQGAIDELNNKTNAGNATADNISSGKTAMVNGTLITGTGADVDAASRSCQIQKETLYVTLSRVHHDGSGYSDTQTISITIKQDDGTVLLSQSMNTSSAYSQSNNYTFTHYNTVFKVYFYRTHIDGSGYDDRQTVGARIEKEDGTLLFSDSMTTSSAYNQSNDFNFKVIYVE